MTTSIIVPTFDRAALVGEAIASVLGQTEADLELIVVDDGSTDDTRAVVDGFASDVRLHYVRQANQGRSAARNHGARLARGEIVGFLDSDDRLAPDALAAHLAVFHASPDVGMTVGGYLPVDAAGAAGPERRPWESGGGLGLEGWLFDCYGMPGSVMHRRAWLDKVGGFDPGCEIAEDWDLYLRLAAAGCPMAWVRRPVCLYRQHDGNSLREVARHRAGALRALEKLTAAPGVPRPIADRVPQARAWTNVVYARQAWAHGDGDACERWLREAVDRDPALAGPSRIRLIEFLLAPASWAAPEAHRPPSEGVIAVLPAGLRDDRRAIRRARANVAMAEMFRAARRGADREVIRHGWRGARLDPTWLGNRGVVASLARAGTRGAARMIKDRLSFGRAPVGWRPESRDPT